MDDPAALARIAKGAPSTTAALALLHEAGSSPVKAIKALHDGRGLTLRDAKRELHFSPAWAEEARAAEALWDELDALVQSEERSDPLDVPASREPKAWAPPDSTRRERSAPEQEPRRRARGLIVTYWVAGVIVMLFVALGALRVWASQAGFYFLFPYPPPWWARWLLWLLQ